MKKVNEELFKIMQVIVTQDCDMHVKKKDMERFAKDTTDIYYSEYTIEGGYKSFMVSEKMKCDLEKHGGKNKVSLYFTSDSEMDELSEMLDGLNGKTSEIIWASCSNKDSDVEVLKTALLFFKI